MNNKTSREISSAKLDSRKYHAKQNEKLYKEYLESSAQYTISFQEWKNSNQKRKKRKKETMQKPLTNGEKKALHKKTPRSLNEIYRYK
jgi:hypothetical protein